MYTIAGVRLPWIRISVPATVRSSMLIQFSAAGSTLDLPCEVAAPDMGADIPTGSVPPATGKKRPCHSIVTRTFSFTILLPKSLIPYSSIYFDKDVQEGAGNEWLEAVTNEVYDKL